MKNGINTAEIGKKLMECSVFKAKILTKSSIKIANASLFEILYITYHVRSILNQFYRFVKNNEFIRAL